MAGRRWTEEEDNYLIENYKKIKSADLKDIKENIGFSVSGIKIHAIELGLFVKKEYNKLTEEQNQFIIDNYEKMKVCEIAKSLGVKETKVRNSAQTLGVKKGTKKEEWSNEDIEVLKENYGVLSYGDIAKLLSRENATTSAIQTKVSNLGLAVGHWWTKEEESVLFELYPRGEREVILSKLKNRKWKNVINKAVKLGIKREIQPWTEEEDNVIIDNWETLEDFELLDLLPNRTHRSIKWRRQELGLQRNIGSSVGNICVSKNNDKCHSIDECKLINYIYKKGFVYEKDVPYKELILNDETNRTCDVCIYINDKIYAIEYFGIYRKTPRNKIEESYVEKMAYKYDSFMHNSKNNVIFVPIFPDDIEKGNSKRMEKIINDIYEKEN